MIEWYQMTRAHPLDVKPSPFRIGNSGTPIGIYQDQVGRPETGIWTQEDEDAHTQWQLNQRWDALRISSGKRLPKNWFYTNDPK